MTHWSYGAVNLRPAQRSTRVRRILTAVPLVIILLLPTGCFRYSTDQNTIVTGNLAYVYFRKIATDQVVDALHYQLNSGNERTTLSQMLTWTKSKLFKSRLAAVGFYLSDFDYFFDPDNDADFEEAAANVHNNSRCLVMHRNLNFLPWPAETDRHNWTFREGTDRYCTAGKGYG